MSRIDQAVRRTKGNTGADHEPDPFIVPWRFDDEAEDLGDVTGHSTVVAPSPRPLLGEPRLATLDGFHPGVLHKLVTGPTIPAPGLEQYRALAAELHQAQQERGTRSVMVASAMPGEGKTLTAANLALLLSDSYQRQVLLVDADLRRPALHELFGVENSAGLSDGARAGDGKPVPLVRLRSRLALLPAGPPPADPAGALGSEWMRRVMSEAKTAFDWVVIDSSPAGVLTDAHLVAPMTDAVILVVLCGITPLSSVQRAVQALGRDRIAGVVLNRVGRAAPAERDVYHYYAKGRRRNRRLRPA
jgi:capsular exopolysaccharide synthesis family protein